MSASRIIHTWSLCLLLMGMASQAIASHNAPPIISPETARETLSNLGIPYTVEALFDAAKKDDLRIVHLFYMAGTSLDTKNSVYGSPLIKHAVDWGAIKVARYLMDHDVDLNATMDHNGKVVLAEAISSSNYEMTYALLNRGAWAGITSAKALDPFRGGGSPLLYALLGPDPVLVKALFKRSGHSLLTERYGPDAETPLMSAAETTSVEVVVMLLDAGASVTETDKNGATALHYAVAENTKFDVVRLLITAGSDVKHMNTSGWTPFFRSIVLGDPYVTRLLLDHGADVNRQYTLDSGHLPMPYTMDKKYSVLVDAFSGGVTPLMHAAAVGNKEVVRTLLDFCADASVVAEGKRMRYTAESLAIAGGYTEIANTIQAFRKAPCVVT